MNTGDALLDKVGEIYRKHFRADVLAPDAMVEELQAAINEYLKASPTKIDQAALDAHDRAYYAKYDDSITYTPTDDRPDYAE